MESNKDRQYRTDHDRCWYTVKVKLALLARTARTVNRKPRRAPFLKCGHTIDRSMLDVSTYGWLWLDTPRLSRRSTRPSTCMRCPGCTHALGS